jgi:hypothetical protein
MNPAKADIRGNERRCVRCGGVFCRIDVREGKLKVVVGARAE